MGFDIVHMNLHKTFAVPHGGGRPGRRPGGGHRAAGSVPARTRGRCAGGRRLRVVDAGNDHRPGARLARQRPRPGPGRTATSWPTAATACGGWPKRAVLNANWLRHRLRGVYDIPYDRPNMHEFVASTTSLKKADGAAGHRRGQAPPRGGLPRADRLLPADRRRGADDRADGDREPSRRSKRSATRFERIADRATAARAAEAAHAAPRTTPVGRVDEARAARHSDPDVRAPRRRRSSSRADASAQASEEVEPVQLPQPRHRHHHQHRRTGR